MKLSQLTSLRDDIDQAASTDPQFRRMWDEKAFAREVATRIVGYRADNHLTQAGLARIVGLKQPAIARLETGEDTPTLKTLVKITAATGLQFHLNVVHGTVEIDAA